MPLITVTYSSPRQPPSLKSDIAAAVSELTAKILHKDPKVTAIIVKSTDAADWFTGGKSLAEQKLASYWLDCQRGHQHQGRKGGLSRRHVRAHGRAFGAAAP
jgi:phenylpyruvate tautomerase PptA (4-oxalocrotonate tautomerase family)